ncbi:MAG: hypothetical protein QM765_05180 [Myxococcales bacterium]
MSWADCVFVIGPEASARGPSEAAVRQGRPTAVLARLEVTGVYRHLLAFKALAERLRRVGLARPAIAG